MYCNTKQCYFATKLLYKAMLVCYHTSIPYSIYNFHVTLLLVTSMFPSELRQKSGKPC